MNDLDDIEALEYKLGDLVGTLDGQVAAQAAALGPYVLAHRVRVLTEAMAANTAAVETASGLAHKNAAVATRIAWVGIACLILATIITIVFG